MSGDRPWAAATRRPLPRWAVEALGVAVAGVLGIALVAAVAASTRSELLFRDADSLVTTLVVRSLESGQPQDWAMSTVLFVPETAMLWVLSLLGLGVNGTLALAGVVSVLALYGGLRVAAGRAGGTRMPVAGALLALAGFALLAAGETSPSRDALELASLLTTTTYYSATVVGTVLAVGLARRGLDSPSSHGPQTPDHSGDGSRGIHRADPAEPVPRTHGRRVPGAAGSGAAVSRAAGSGAAVSRAAGWDALPWGHVVGIGLVAAASVATNPMFAAWATAPLGLVLVAVGLRERVALWLAAGLAVGTALGFAARMPLAHLIANTGAGYADPAQWLASLGYYGGLLAERWTAPWGAVSIVAVAVLWTWCLVASVRLGRRRELGAAVVAACGWVMPLLVVTGAIALGTHAARYLQPAAFAPLLGLVVLPALVAARSASSRRSAVAARSGIVEPGWSEASGASRNVGHGRSDASRASRNVGRGWSDASRASRAIGRGWSDASRASRVVGPVAVIAATAVAVAAALGLGVPRIAAAASAPDPDLDCVTAWTDRAAAAGRTGAGQFWTVRLPKAHLADPRSLVQVDHQLNGYAWLVNRDDFAAGEVSFLVVDGQSAAFDLPGDVTTMDTSPVDCGRYTILDFGSRTLPLGPQRS